MSRVRSRRLGTHVTLIALVALWIIPVLGLLISSFRRSQDVSGSGWWTALRPSRAFTLANYRQVFDARGLSTSFINSLTITVPATIIGVGIGSVTGFVFARMTFRGREVAFAVVLGLLTLPLQLTLAPVLRLFRDLGMIGTFPAIWIAHLGFGLPFIVFVMRNYFASLPKEIFEAAEIDGSTHFTSFVYLALPVAVPALAAVSIFQFMFVWNDLLIALIFLGGTTDVAPLTVTVSNLVGSRGEGWEVLTAAAFVHMAIPLTIFFALQRYFIRGLLAGTTK